ncbi:MAG: hypothetical protein WAQ52_10750 [Terriglobales bacterium]
MWIEKLADGVLQVDTPIGPRYVRLNFTQRAYLMWMFRHFPSLPQQVLSSREQRMVDRLCEENGFASMPGVGALEAPVIGRIEKRLSIQPIVLPMRKPVSGSKSAVPERGSEAASA